MENTLKKFFDFQKFAGNAALNKVIDATHTSYEMRQRKSTIRELDLDEMEWLAAAGAPEMMNKKNELF